MGWEGGSDTHFLVAIVVCVDAISAGHPMLARLKRGGGDGRINGEEWYKMLEKFKTCSVWPFYVRQSGKKGRCGRRERREMVE